MFTHGLENQKQLIQGIGEIGAKDDESRADASGVQRFVQTDTRARTHARTRTHTHTQRERISVSMRRHCMLR